MTTSATADHLADLDLSPNEASGLVRVYDPALLRHFDCDLGFWTVLDEVDIAQSIVLLGHRNGDRLDSGWIAERLATEPHAGPGRAKDAEAVAFWDGHVYVIGSHHGGKDGPIRREEQWVARFDEAAVVGSGDAGKPGVRLRVVDTGFRVHRWLNDALKASGVELVEMTDLLRHSFIDETMAQLRDTPEEGLVQSGDWTVNIEGAEFTPDGDLLLGLRFPVAADGRPLVVQVAQWSRLFDQPMDLPQAAQVWAQGAIGRDGSMAGVRDLCVLDDELHVVTGDLDSAGKGSVIRKDLPGGNDTVSTHFAMPMPTPATPNPAARVITEFPDNPRIEGIAADGHDRFFYVSDEDETIRVRSTPLLTGRE